MFYDTQRIIRKQQKYEKTKAYAIISDLKSGGLSNKEVIASLDVLLMLDDNTETQTSILQLAKKILELKENQNEEVTNCPITTSRMQLVT